MTNLITKREVLDAANRGEGSLGKAADDEPVFVLRAQDLLAPRLISEWIERMSSYPKRRGGKIEDAREVLKAMTAWQDSDDFDHEVKVPD